MAPYSEFQKSAPCQYFEHILSTLGEVNHLTWRVVHCRKPAISAIEILDADGNVIATAHTIGTATIPTEKQVASPLNVPTYDPKTERLFLIRGASKDFAILKASWSGFVKGQQLGKLQLKLFRLGKGNGQWIQLRTNPSNPFQWRLYEFNSYVDLEQSIIQISKYALHVPENICIATAISMALYCANQDLHHQKIQKMKMLLIHLPLQTSQEF